MTKTELYKIMEDNCIFPSEVDDAIQFVRDLLEFHANELEKNEPYAINTIERLRKAAYDVGYLQDYVDDAREEGL
jgi:hypothetical protein